MRRRREPFDRSVHTRLRRHLLTTRSCCVLSASNIRRPTQCAKSLRGGTNDAGLSRWVDIFRRNYIGSWLFSDYKHCLVQGSCGVYFGGCSYLGLRQRSRHFLLTVLCQRIGNKNGRVEVFSFSANYSCSSCQATTNTVK